ncbi:hypothetical protein VCRA2110O318_100174 [Vibrio crassostreae]|nr:hypothetical protein VCRA2110O318_100174 [Vibrio crassostreae]CAK2396657.1 hypothetical protein VCRA2110O319_100173 [Vibrio crassostreae]CAK2565345.1 hypothetical protein VCRA217O317_100029 [Vibrio crassostreae]
MLVIRLFSELSLTALILSPFIAICYKRGGYYSDWNWVKARYHKEIPSPQNP